MMRFFKFQLVLAVTPLFLGCASMLKPKAIATLHDQGPVRLEANAKLGAKDQTAYFYRTRTLRAEGGQVTRKTVETVEFTVDSEVTGKSLDGKLTTYKIKTVAKDGKADLADYAMPELGEELTLTLDRQGGVTEVQNFPPGTIYYVPPVSLPTQEVKVGDSWPLTAEWISLKTGIPLRMEIVTILKSLRDCGGGRRCAELEVSGDVSIVGAANNQLASKTVSKEDLKLRFSSRISGYILYSIEDSSVLYSYTKSDERLAGETENIEITSCNISRTTLPLDLARDFRLPRKCGIDEQVPTL